MSIPDKAMGSYSRLVTRWTNDQIEAFEHGDPKSGAAAPAGCQDGIGQ